MSDMVILSILYGALYCIGGMVLAYCAYMFFRLFRKR